MPRLYGAALVNLRAQLTSATTPKAKEDEEWKVESKEKGEEGPTRKSVYRRGLEENFGDWKAELDRNGYASKTILAERFRIPKYQAADLIDEATAFNAGKHDREIDLYMTLVARVRDACKFFIEGLIARINEFFSSIEEMVEFTEGICK